MGKSETCQAEGKETPPRPIKKKEVGYSRLLGGGLISKALIKEACLGGPRQADLHIYPPES